jgi:glycosyltransferase involved in cell wall biosynthesis
MTAFSIIVPAYNAESTLESTLACLDLQTERDFEVIVVDDGATDGTGALADRLCAARGWRVVHQENRGLPGARNAGIAEAHGRWITLLDADDWLLPTFLARMRELLESREGVGLAFVDAWIWDVDLGRYARRSASGRYRPHPIPTEQWAFFRTLMVVNYVYGAACFPRALAEQLGGFTETLPAAEDWEMWLRIAASGAPVVGSDERLAIYRHHSTQMSRDLDRMWQGALLCLQSVQARCDLPDDVAADLAARIRAHEASPPGTQPSRGWARELLGLSTRWAGPVRDYRLRAPAAVTGTLGDLSAATATPAPAPHR